jgi:membrane-bound lytic murein transglycosylase B
MDNLNYKNIFSLIIALYSLLAVSVSYASGNSVKFSDRVDVLQFIDTMASKHDFNRDSLKILFSQVKPRPDIIEAITHPAEAKPWHQYRPIFLTESRIRGGVDFWNKNADTLARAEETYGVPAEIIVAIIGVETRYGKYKGKHSVMESLTTLAFDYPKRGKFFRKELEEFLLLSREENIDPLSLKGSYAGAMGGPQFISSSYRHYAVDFDGDGKRDLWENNVDIIGSVANYFKVHGWEKGAPITSRAQIGSQDINPVVEKGLKPSRSLKQLRSLEVIPEKELADDLQSALIMLETKNAPEYWLGLKNFYVITRYNHSALYAMAVYQLSEEIKSLRKKRAANMEK